MRGVILWLLGIPISVIILLYLFSCQVLSRFYSSDLYGLDMLRPCA